MTRSEIIHLLNFSVLIHLGDEGMFEGSLSRVEIYGFVFDGETRTKVYNKELIQLDPIIPWDNYESGGVTSVRPSCFGCSTCFGCGMRNSFNLLHKANQIYHANHSI